MKRWASLTVLLYLLILVTLTVPLLMFGGVKWSSRGGASMFATHNDLEKGLSIYREWGYWVWAGGLVAGQALLLFVPLRAAQQRPTSRRHLLVPVITTAFLFANLLVAGISCLLVLPKKDGSFESVDKLVKASQNLALQTPVVKSFFAAFTPGDLDGIFYLAHMIGIVVLCWIGWAMLFHRFAKSGDPHALTRRLTQWLVRGSILELLVAVPSHIFVRRRADCCAPMFTFWGMVTGLAIMLLAFGPGVFFLFIERVRRRQPRLPPSATPGKVPPGL